MTRQNNPKIQTGSGQRCSKPEIPKATECTKERKQRLIRIMKVIIDLNLLRQLLLLMLHL